MKSMSFLYYTVYTTIFHVRRKEQDMNIIRTTQPDDRQIKDILNLVSACQSHDHISLTFPTEDSGLSYLLYDKGQLLSAFSAFFNENETCSCSAFTHPEFRRRGFFTRLLEEVLEEPGEWDLIFSADDACPDTRFTLKALEAKLLNREHMMELNLSAASLIQSCRETQLHPTVRFRPEDTRYTVTQNGQPAGSFHLIFFKDAVYFYGFEIQKPLRNQGAGTRAMTALLHQLACMEEHLPNRILLQVSGDNAPAMAIYKKLGFQITETLSYYIY